MSNYFNGTSTIGFTCDNCGRELLGCTWVNGMKFCAKCYQETYGNKNMTENLNNMYEAYLKILNEKDQRIAILEEQLKNAIAPKFKIGQEVYVIIQDAIRTTAINSFRVFANNELSYYCKYVDGERMYLELDESDIFATKEEAQAKLEELKNE